MPDAKATPAHVYAWTFFSGCLYASTSFVILMLVTNCLDGYWGGVVAIALALSQQMFTLGSFNMRRYQVSDATNRFELPDYAGSRLITCLLMVAVGCLWTVCGDFSPDKRTAVFWLVVLKASEAFSDVLEGYYQLQGRLDVSGRILAFKSFFSMVVFAAVLFCTRSLNGALAGMALAHISFFFIADRPVLSRFGPCPLRPRFDRIFPLLGACVPLAVDAFLRMYINNGPKFAIDRLMDESSTAAYSSLFMVSFVVAIFSDFLINPQIVPLSRAFHEGKHGVFFQALVRQLCAVLALGAAGIACAWFLGAPILSWVFGMDLMPYQKELCVLLAGGTFLALYHVAQLVLIVLRKQAWCLLSITLATVFVIVSASRFVSRWMLEGGAACYCAAMAVLFAATSLQALFFLRGAVRRPTAS